MTIADQLAVVQHSLGELTAGHKELIRGQEDARTSRARTYERMDASDVRFYEAMAAQNSVLADLTATVRTISVTASMNNEVAVKLLERVDTLEGTVQRIEPVAATLKTTVDEIAPMARVAAAFRIEALPIISIVKQVRLAIVALIAFFTVAAGVGGWAYANAGPILRTLVIEWLKSGGPTPPA